MVLPRAMDIEGGDRDITWRWTQNEEKCFGGHAGIAVPELLKLSWLAINGSFNTNALSPKTTYEAAFVVKLREICNTWPLPVNSELYLPDGKLVNSAESLAKKPIEKWIKLRVGKFVTHPKNVGKIRFVLHERSQIYKSGLVLRGLLLHPKD
ncbi:uncharacterized protein PHLOEM PROTEIN 2-LIKE A4-like [Eucalyptus grandis]|uniref:uncharacterized protein PHLOEM PROTEIN 2-LIKE A4-like n=1 Tax=Eucalyptus grandis TaxID=71139 RepID=UPI00192E879B|nr:uncharacterized protein PHLOEM PROTEIN 2-LIKE A4-like [Eucalyptus grandis]